MVKIGNFFFKYRNWLFIIFYALLFVPHVPQLFTPKNFGEHYYLYPIIIGLIITVAGQAIRGATIGLAYIIRGGKNKKVYAEDLVTTGIFAHCRNPLVCWKYFNACRCWYFIKLIIICGDNDSIFSFRLPGNCVSRRKFFAQQIWRAV